MKSQIANLRSSLYQELKNCQNLNEIEQFKIKALGKKSDLSSLLKQMGSLDNELRKEIGSLVNNLRQELEVEINKIQNVFKDEAIKQKMAANKIDITMPAMSFLPSASLHPITKIIEEIEDIFIGMGYQVAEGPEIEWLKYNFDALRIFEGHPAREDKDTFYIDEDRILRTQTSPVQIRIMEENEPPIKIIAPGRVYRPDTPDATHSPVFHQIEGLVIDKGIAMADLVGTLKLFATKLFGEDSKIRLRPHHFPFTEPSCEVDVSCWTCHGKGCPTCKNEGFIEILGAGMVHPWVIENCKLDPNIYTGFAFGIGVERTAMARFGITDIRYMYENNLQFLKQFK